MKKAKLIAGALIIISAVSLKPIKANAEWKKDSNGWRYTEGGSYITGWKKMDGEWYYFYKNDKFNKKGYMAHDTIIDGYYLNNIGILADKQPEIKVYSDLLKDTEWQKNNRIIFNEDKSTIYRDVVIDINQDGVFEMLLFNGTCSADHNVCVVTYNNGSINAETIYFNGEYLGYSKSSNMFFVNGGHMGNYYTEGYTLLNNKCNRVFLSTDEEIYSNNSNGETVISGHNYTINQQSVSQAEYNQYMQQFGNIY